MGSIGFWLLRHFVLVLLAIFLITGYILRDSINQALNRITAPSSIELASPALQQAQQPEDQVIAQSGVAAPASPVAGIVPESSPQASFAVVRDEKPPVTVGEYKHYARKAYWDGDMDSAEQGYLAAIELEPRNPDLRGELGNIYFQIGEHKLAAMAYFDTAQLLSENGLQQYAAELVPVVGSLDEKLAVALYRKLSDTGPQRR